MRRLLGLLLLACVACSGEEDPPDLGTPVDPCAGDGEAAVSAGIWDPPTSFAAWSDGGSVPVVRRQGEYAFEIGLQMEGLDATAEVTVDLQYSYGTATTAAHAGGAVDVLCDGSTGLGWTGLFIHLDDSEQNAQAVENLDGAPLPLTVTATDQALDEASQHLDLVITAP